MTTRRHLVKSLSAAALSITIPVLAQSQPARVPQIGFFGSSSATALAARIEVFRTGLRELGYEEGKNVIVEWRHPGGEAAQLSGVATEFVKLKVDVIVAWGGAATRAAQRATKTIPIVMIGPNDPVGTGLVASLSRPGGNTTGVTNLGVDVSSKYVEMLREALPKLSRVALLTTRTPTAARILNSVQSATKVLGVKLLHLQAETASEIETAFGLMSRERVEALVVMADPILAELGREIVTLAARQRLPTMLPNPTGVDAGGLMGYWAVIPWKRVATYVDKILKGAKPAELPVEQPTTFELVVNLKTAKTLGITIPQSILVRATKVIE